jgi:hypothetical protein
MSDFVSSGWSLYVAAVTILGLVCLVLLLIASKRKVMAWTTTPPATSGTRTCAR